jgi:hypothetical protein
MDGFAVTNGSQDANFTAGNRELSANRPRVADDLVLVTTESGPDVVDGVQAGDESIAVTISEQ